MKILGIDPGTTRIGYGIITGNPLAFLDCGVLHVDVKSQREKLSNLNHRFRALLTTTKPDVAGIETLFFSKNQKTALFVAEARGILILALQEARIPFYECKPHEVKLAVCGYGLADKKSVAKMVWKSLGMHDLDQYDDATDALAVAITAEGKAKFEARLRE